MSLNSLFSNIVNSISGKNKNELTSQSLTIQQQIAQNSLQNDLEEIKLKYSPELSKQRTLQIAIIGVPILLLLGVFIYIKFIK